MKSLWISLLILLFAIPATAFTVRTTAKGELVKWDSDEIDVYLSPSLEMLGPVDDVYFAIEDAFDTWVHESDIDLTVNFIYEECEAGYASNGNNTNCIYASPSASSTNEDAGGNASITFSQSDGEIFDGDIVFFVGAGTWKFDDDDQGLDFKHVALHEIGHFLGLTHSQIDKAVMYPTVNLHSMKVSSLHEDDIFGALALYDSRKLEDSASCQFAPAADTQSISLFSLLISLFF